MRRLMPPMPRDLGPIRFDLEGTRLILRGPLRVDSLQHVTRAEAEVLPDGVEVIDLSEVSQIDTAGAWFVLTQQRAAERAGRRLAIEGPSTAQAQLIETVRAALPELPPEGAARAGGPAAALERFGRRVVQGGHIALGLTGFLGEVVAAIAALLWRPGRLRLTSVVHHCQEVGFNAVPIVALMSFLIGVVLAFQGAAQLRQFGAEVFVVDLIAISVLRELGILLTAIIVAGRSGSAFTAAIGAMKMREEIDAMRTLGLDPVTILVVPRVLALIVMLPALGLLANLSGLIGGALMAWIELGVSPAVFQSRLVTGTDVWHFAVGMIKAPFFALLIGVIGCFEGMMVGGNAETLGRRTSAAVVLAIFMVIVVDAMFSIFFSVVGV